MAEKFLNRVYDDQSPAETRTLYDAWAESYEAELAENGYATPGRAAAALWDALPEPDAPILDFGCGTGLSGLALKTAGYRVIDGTDPSPAMLERAGEKAVYRSLELLDPEAGAPLTPGSHRAVAAIGVIGPGAAPAETLDLLMNGLAPDALLVFSLADPALADPQYIGRLNQWLDCGAARLLSTEYGDHLPGQNMKSNIYVVEKA